MFLINVINCLFDNNFFNPKDSLISEEGMEILSDPVKRVKLRQWIENYHSTGVWDYSFWSNEI